MRARLVEAIRNKYPRTMAGVINLSIIRLSSGEWSGHYFATLHHTNVMKNQYVRFIDVDEFKRNMSSKELKVREV